MFAPARGHRARHPSILLPLDAVLAARRQVAQAWHQVFDIALEIEG